jgi:surfactin synthase thioesterase subunit
MSEDSIPLVFLGHSFGTTLAFECACYLEHQLRLKIDLLLSLAGITKEYLSSTPLYSNPNRSLENNPWEEVVDILRKTSMEMYGTIPPYMDPTHDRYDEEMMKYTVQDVGFTTEWLRNVNHEETNKLACNFTWIVGRDDKTTSLRYDGWKVSMQSIQYIYDKLLI